MTQEKEWWEEMARTYFKKWWNENPFSSKNPNLSPLLQSIISEAQRLERERVCGVLEAKLKTIEDAIDQEKEGSIPRLCFVTQSSALQDVIDEIKKLSPEG